MSTRYFLSTLLLLLSIMACKKDAVTSDDALSLVPMNSAGVLRVDIPSLMKKADFEALRKTEMYKQSVEDAREKNPSLAKALEDPAESGIDLEKMGYLFFHVNPENTRETFNGFLLSLADSKKLEALAKTEGEVVSKGKFRYILSEEDNILAWTDDVALFGFSDDLINLVDQAGLIFETKPSESVAANKDLQKALADSHDLSLWLNSNPFSESPDLQMGMSMAEVDAEALKDNYIHGYLDFLEGRIEGTADLFLQTKLTKDLNRLFNDKVGSGFAKYVPAENLDVFLAAAINIKGIDEVLSARSQSKGFLEFSLKEFGLTTKDFRETFGGDVIVAAVGQEESDKRVGVFATNILDEKKLQLFLDLGVERGSLEKERANQYKVKEVSMGRSDGFFHITMDDGAPRLLVKDGYLFLCGDENWLYNLENGGFPNAQRLKGEQLNSSTNHLFYAYFDANALRAFNKGPGDYSVKDLEINASREQVKVLVHMNQEKMNALKAMFEGAAKKYEANTPEPAVQ